MQARVIRLEADVKHSLAMPKTVDEALAELESKVVSGAIRGRHGDPVQIAAALRH